MLAKLCGALLGLLLFSSNAWAQDKKERKPGDIMIEQYLAAETDKLSKKFMDGARTLDEWQKKRPHLYREYMDMLGLWPLPEKTPLKATVTGQVEAHGVLVEKIHFQSKPGLYVTANYYRPRALNGKRLPAIVYVCGHSGRGRDGNKTAFQDHGFWFANNGYVCIILDTLQLGEIPGIHHGTYGIRGTDPVETRFWWHSAGYTPAGVECWNGVRAIDYLLTRPEVDPDKIGVTGISGGGAATFWIAAADDRVKVAVPVSGMSDLESYVKNKVINGHCDCMFLFNTYQWDWTTIGALVAPRPLLFANSDNDNIFPMDGNRRIIAKLRDCYRMFPKPRGESSNPAGKSEGALGVLEEYVSAGGHAYRPDLRAAVFQFFNRHLKGDPTAKVEDSAKYKELPGKELRVFPTDADVPKDQLNTRIDEFFVPRAKVMLPEKGKFAEWKKGMISKLRMQAFSYFPAKIPPAKEKRNWVVETEDVILVNFGLNPHGEESKIFPLVILNHNEEFDWKVFEQFVRRDSFSWAFPRGTYEGGAKQWTTNNWTPKSPPNYVERSHVLLGRTVDEGRVWDIIATGRVASEKTPLKVLGQREAGILAAYAALFEPSIKEVIVINPPKSHKEGPHFLGVLRVLDIPEALGLLAPTPLTIVGGNDPAFDRTAEIYRLAGAADKLTRK